MESTISYLNCKSLLSNKRRYLVKFFLDVALWKEEKRIKNTKKKNGRLDGSDDRGVLEK